MGGKHMTVSTVQKKRDNLHFVCIITENFIALRLYLRTFFNNRRHNIGIMKVTTPKNCVHKNTKIAYYSCVFRKRNNRVLVRVSVCVHICVCVCFCTITQNEIDLGT